MSHVDEVLTILQLSATSEWTEDLAPLALTEIGSSCYLKLLQHDVLGGQRVRKCVSMSLYRHSRHQVAATYTQWTGLNSVWITDKVLEDAWQSFTRSCRKLHNQQHKRRILISLQTSHHGLPKPIAPSSGPSKVPNRYGSSTPGPLEAQKRASRRRFMGLASGGPDPTGLLDPVLLYDQRTSSKRSWSFSENELRWEAPDNGLWNMGKYEKEPNEKSTGADDIVRRQVGDYLSRDDTRRVSNQLSDDGTMSEVPRISLATDLKQVSYVDRSDLCIGNPAHQKKQISLTGLPLCSNQIPGRIDVIPRSKSVPCRLSRLTDFEHFPESDGRKRVRITRREKRLRVSVWGAKSKNTNLRQPSENPATQLSTAKAQEFTQSEASKVTDDMLSQQTAGQQEQQNIQQQKKWPVGIQRRKSEIVDSVNSIEVLPRVTYADVVDTASSQRKFQALIQADANPAHLLEFLADARLNLAAEQNFLALTQCYVSESTRKVLKNRKIFGSWFRIQAARGLIPAEWLIKIFDEAEKHIGFCKTSTESMYPHVAYSDLCECLCVGMLSSYERPISQYDDRILCRMMAILGRLHSMKASVRLAKRLVSAPAIPKQQQEILSQIYLRQASHGFCGRGPFKDGISLARCVVVAEFVNHLSPTLSVPLITQETARIVTGHEGIWETDTSSNEAFQQTPSLHWLKMLARTKVLAQARTEFPDQWKDIERHLDLHGPMAVAEYLRDLSTPEQCIRLVNIWVPHEMVQADIRKRLDQRVRLFQTPSGKLNRVKRRFRDEVPYLSLFGVLFSASPLLAESILPRLFAVLAFLNRSEAVSQIVNFLASKKLCIPMSMLLTEIRRYLKNKPRLARHLLEHDKRPILEMDSSIITALYQHPETEPEKMEWLLTRSLKLEKLQSNSAPLTTTTDLNPRQVEMLHCAAQAAAEAPYFSITESWRTVVRILALFIHQEHKLDSRMSKALRHIAIERAVQGKRPIGWRVEATLKLTKLLDGPTQAGLHETAVREYEEKMLRTKHRSMVNEDESDQTDYFATTIVQNHLEEQISQSKRRQSDNNNEQDSNTTEQIYSVTTQAPSWHNPKVDKVNNMQISPHNSAHKRTLGQEAKAGNSVHQALDEKHKDKEERKIKKTENAKLLRRQEAQMQCGAINSDEVHPAIKVCMMKQDDDEMRLHHYDPAGDQANVRLSEVGHFDPGVETAMQEVREKQDSKRFPRTWEQVFPRPENLGLFELKKLELKVMNRLARILAARRELEHRQGGQMSRPQTLSDAARKFDSRWRTRPISPEQELRIEGSVQSHQIT